MDTKNWKQSFRLRCLPRFFPPLKQKDLPMNSESICYDNTLKTVYWFYLFWEVQQSQRYGNVVKKQHVFILRCISLYSFTSYTRGECSNHFPLCMHISILFVVSSQVVHTCHQTFASQWNTFSCIAFILCTGNTLCHALPKP